MGFKLGDISPLAGIATGQGLTGKLARAGGLGLLPGYISRDAYSSDEEEKQRRMQAGAPAMKKGGAVKKHAKGGKVASASKRADGCAQRGKTKGRVV